MKLITTEGNQFEGTVEEIWELVCKMRPALPPARVMSDPRTVSESSTHAKKVYTAAQQAAHFQEYQCPRCSLKIHGKIRTSRHFREAHGMTREAAHDAVLKLSIPPKAGIDDALLSKAEKDRIIAKANKADRENGIA